MRELLESILSHNLSFEDYLAEHVFPTGHYRMLFNARSIIGNTENERMILLAIEIDK